ncbi:MAG: LysR family transcriptional regulator [Opitutaceae bacterium]|nr:LysR family transcriptional regulator [Cytophagales bacterium]
MTITQLQYIVAVSELKSFVKAADKCSVTQPTLSMQIQKLEEELNIKLFDRSKQPVIATLVGEEILSQARVVLNEFNLLSKIARKEDGKVSGRLNLAVIPTLAPYFLPTFINKFLSKYPEVELHIFELSTEEIRLKLKAGTIDCGLLATPLLDYTLTELVMFYEPFVAYISRNNHLFDQKEIDSKQLNLEETWIINEGHCLRNQVLNLCQESREVLDKSFNYESGSLETLKRLVELDQGLTVLPLLATLDLSENQQELVRHFKTPIPVREISLVIHRQFLKKKLVDAVSETILNSVPPELKDSKNRFVVPL